MILHHVEPCLKNLLQRDIRFEVNGKIIREGKLVLYNIKDFYLSFTLRTEKHPSKIYEIPCPYYIDSNGNDLLLDYKNQNIYKSDQKLMLLINSLHKNSGKKSKLFDNVLLIKTKKLA